jgi:hypothetical protein
MSLVIMSILVIDLLNKLDQIVVYTLPLKSNDVEIGEVIIGVQLTRNK